MHYNGLRMRLLLRRWPCIFLLAVTALSQAKIEESKDLLIGMKQHNLLRENSNGEFSPAFPVAPTGKEVYVVFYQGATYRRVLAMGAVNADAKALAQVLDTWQKTQSLDRTVQWSQEDDGAAATLSLPSNAHFGLSSSSTTFRVGEVLAAFTSAGYQPLGVGVSGLYPKVEGPGKHMALGSSIISDYRGVSPDAQENVSASIPASAGPLLIIWLFFVPIVTFAGFGIAVWYGKQVSVPLAQRRRLYPKIALGSTFGAIGIHALSFLWLMTTSGLKELMDLSFGTTDVINIIPAIMIGPLVLILLIPLTKKSERKLFGVPDAAAEPAPEMQPAVKLAMKRRLIAMIPIFVLGAGFIFGGILLAPKSHREFRMLSMIAGYAIIFGGAWLLNKTVLKQDVKTISGTVDGSLSKRVQELAFKLGAKSLPVLLKPNEQYIIVTTGTDLGKLSISQAALNELTPSELDFLIAQELAKRKLSSTSALLMTLLPGYFLIVAPMFYLLFAPPPHPQWLVPASFSFMMVYMGGMFFFVGRRHKSNTYEADRNALYLLGDLDAALSGLQKMAARSPMPGTWDNDTMNRPSLPNRLAALKQAMATR